MFFFFFPPLGFTPNGWSTPDWASGSPACGIIRKRPSLQIRQDQTQVFQRIYKRPPRPFIADLSAFLITGNYSTIALFCPFQHKNHSVLSLQSTSLHENASPTQASVLHQVLVPTQRSYDTLAPTRLDPGRRFLPARLLGCFCHVCMTWMGIIKC